MKTIWIMRHAKSDWSHAGLADIDRPLNNRGRRDAPLVGRWMGSLAKQPDLVVSSPARRARQTVALLTDAFSYTGEMRVWEDLYPGSAASSIAALQGLPQRHRHVLLVGHNPNMEELVSGLVSEGALRLKVPTATVILLAANIENWSQLAAGIAELRGMVTPKMLRRNTD
jgi:phosphohistidine phosphatase